MNLEEMTCERARELAALAASGDVTMDARNALELHTAGCASCRAEADAFQALCGQLAAMRAESAPDHVYSAVRARVAADIRGGGQPHWITAWPALAGVAACSLIVLIALHRSTPVVAEPALSAPVVSAGIRRVAPKAVIPAPSLPVRKTVKRAVTQESAEPLVVQMFTNDPDVVIYWIADAKRKGPEKEIVQ